jgi:hypothetical protein
MALKSRKLAYKGVFIMVAVMGGKDAFSTFPNKEQYEI